MTVEIRSFVKQLDKEHIKALMVGQRLDVAGHWRVREFIRPIIGDGFEFSSLIYPNRAAAESLQRMLQIDIAEQQFMGLIAGGTPLLIPANFCLRADEPGGSKELQTFDMRYGQRFPTAEEVAAEAQLRGL